MKSLLIQLDEPTYRALNRVVTAGKRQPTEFVRAVQLREMEIVKPAQGVVRLT